MDGRLNSEIGPNVGNVQYEYDNVGNRLDKIVNNTVAQSFTYDADDRVLSYNGNTGAYTYDNNGNVLTEGTKTYQWDYDNMHQSAPRSQAGSELAVFDTGFTSTNPVIHVRKNGAVLRDVIEERDSSGILEPR